MAGSFNHIVDDQGAFTMETIENMGDAHEALENCFDVIALLIQQLPPPFRKSVLRDVCERASSPTPQVLPVFHTRAKEPSVEKLPPPPKFSAEDALGFKPPKDDK